MQANIKFDGAVLLQLQGDGPLKLAVAEAQPDLAFRATAKVVGPVAAADSLADMANLHGQGRCAITLDPRAQLPGQQPYQGVVPLHGDQREPLTHLAQALEHYMLQSEQLDTKLVLAANDDFAAGLLLQRMPPEGEGNLAGSAAGGWKQGDEAALGASEDFNRLALLAGTLKPEELLGLDVQGLLHRLYWQDTLRLFDAQPLRFACRCSRQRVAGMLRGLGRGEVDGIVAEQGQVEIGCDFCGAEYRFDPVDAAALFSPQPDTPPAPAGVQ
jgi:molecular chaperone Hsp33